MLALVVNLTIQAGKEEKAKEYIRIMEGHTRREPGCRQYIGHQSQEDPRRFLLYELYNDRAALEAHRAAAYFQQFVTNGLSTVVENRVANLFDTVS